MSDIWVYKSDGTRQCDLGKEISLEEMRGELEKLIGRSEVLNAEKRQIPGLFPDVCGAPTGRVNAYEITPSGLLLLFQGFAGPNGFAIWNWPHSAARAKASTDPVPWPFAVLLEQQRKPEAVLNAIAILTNVRQNPTTLSEIVGRPVRCYKQGDGLTLDYRPERVNIETDQNSEIVRIWFG